MLLYGYISALLILKIIDPAFVEIHEEFMPTIQHRQHSFTCPIDFRLAVDNACLVICQSLSPKIAEKRKQLDNFKYILSPVLCKVGLKLIKIPL